MLESDLAHYLIAPSAPAAQNVIIRFRDPELYATTLDRLAALSRDRPPPAGIRTLPSIRAVSCPLASMDFLKQWDERVAWEQDWRVPVRPHSLLPLPLQTRPLPYDRSQRIPWGVQEIAAPIAWKLSKGKGIHIGVVDTGADYSHPDLRGSLGRGVNLLRRYAPPSDDNGHGTHICGTIAATGRAGGITGVAPAAVVHPVKAFDEYGTAYISDIILGIDWCVENGMDIINMSFGMRQRSESLLEAVRKAYRSGVIIVASSGNDGNHAAIDYPARFPYTIAVGAITKSKQVAEFSNRSKQIDIYAPGESIYSTWLRDKYNELSGTSMATAHVSGALALAKSLRPGLTASLLKRYIRQTSVSLSSGRKAKTSGSGVLQVSRMLRLVRASARQTAKKPRTVRSRAGSKSRPAKNIG